MMIYICRVYTRISSSSVIYHHLMIYHLNDSLLPMIMMFLFLHCFCLINPIRVEPICFVCIFKTIKIHLAPDVCQRFVTLALEQPRGLGTRPGIHIMFRRPCSTLHTRKNRHARQPPRKTAKATVVCRNSLCCDCVVMSTVTPHPRPGTLGVYIHQNQITYIFFFLQQVHEY
jgi:hypothetical protein